MYNSLTLSLLQCTVLDGAVVTTGLVSTPTLPLVSLGDTDSILILFYLQRHYDS
jgi:hypothetical protein